MSGSQASRTREKVRALDFDNSINTVVSLDSLAEAEDSQRGGSEWQVLCQLRIIKKQLDIFSGVS